ncbi:replication restart helicase PriA [Acidisarcina polymorpha]|nr:primosomal protein N' [Acidisarcina polymorpha]
MLQFCDVALPVPLDRVFTYKIGEAAEPPAIGCRVIVPFRNEKLTGIVTRIHQEPPPVEAKPILAVLDGAPLLAPDLMELAAWISSYYLAPLGEVFRSMLPLMAEVKHQILYRIADKGREVLYASANQGSSRHSRKSAEDQDVEYDVLNYLEAGQAERVSKLRTATGATLDLLRSMLRKKWLLRETSAVQRDARRTIRYAVLLHDVRIPKLNANQQCLLAELAGAGGEMPVAELRRLDLPDSTLGSLVRRGLVRLEERPADFHLAMQPMGSALVHTLNPAQQAAFKAIAASIGSGVFKPTLLRGVTGSGKTAVYLAAMQTALDAGYSAILLVPEIGLTPAMAAQLYTAFGSEVALLHSALIPGERAEQWHRIRAGEARIVVGTRSAVFAPVTRLGLIVVDEEHDSSYKQEETPRYHARDVAVMRAKLDSSVVVLGSATPSLESWRNATTGKYALIEMAQRVADRPLPVVELVDMRKEFQETGQEQLFSRLLIEETQATLERGEQAIILLNRRGYSFVVLCRACGEKLQCENCAISLTYHRPHGATSLDDADPSPTGQRLQCHYCGYKRTVPKVCPDCESEHLHFLGAGSQQGEQRLQEIFPHARIGRMDRDTVRGRHDMERLLQRLHSGEINLLVGTQMIAKGHDIHGVTLVGVVGADFALGLPNFRAAERVFQLLTQVSGRAGRGELPGRVLVQTYHSDHYAIRLAAAHDFKAFAEKELQFRRWMHYPPFSVLANLIVQSPRLEEAAAWSSQLGQWFANTAFEGVRILGPATAPISRLKRIYRFHFVIKAEKRATLARTLRAALARAEVLKIPSRGLIVDVDAVNLM